MKTLRLGIIIVLAILMVFSGGISWAQQPQRPLRTIIPPPLPEEKEAPVAAEEAGKEEKAPQPEAEKPREKEEPREPAEEENVPAVPKAKTSKELEEEKKRRQEYLKEALALVEKLEYLRITVQFGGEWEEFRKRLLEAGFALYRVKTKAHGPLAQAPSLGMLEAAANNFVHAKDAWEQAKLKKDEANHNYQLAEDIFPETQRRYYRDRRETALGGLADLEAPWAKTYFEFKAQGDAAKRESEQLMQVRESYLNAAYSSLETAKEALKGEIK